MSKKDYIVIAEIIIENYRTSDYTEHDTIELANLFATHLRLKNPKFDISKFTQYVKEGI